MDGYWKVQEFGMANYGRWGDNSQFIHATQGKVCGWSKPLLETSSMWPSSLDPGFEFPWVYLPLFPLLRQTSLLTQIRCSWWQDQLLEKLALMLSKRSRFQPFLERVIPYPFPVIPFLIFLLSAVAAAWTSRWCFWVEFVTGNLFWILPEQAVVRCWFRPQAICLCWMLPDDNRRDHRNNTGKVLFHKTWNEVLLDFT